MLCGNIESTVAAEQVQTFGQVRRQPPKRCKSRATLPPQLPARSTPRPAQHPPGSPLSSAWNSRSSIASPSAYISSNSSCKRRARHEGAHQRVCRRRCRRYSPAPPTHLSSVGGDKPLQLHLLHHKSRLPSWCQQGKGSDAVDRFLRRWLGGSPDRHLLHERVDQGKRQTHACAVPFERRRLDTLSVAVGEVMACSNHPNALTP